MGLLHGEDKTQLVLGCTGLLQAHASTLHLCAALGVQAVPFPPLSSGVISFGLCWYKYLNPGGKEITLK